MSHSNEIRISDFKFKAFKHSMSPLYWQLRRDENLPLEEKIKLIEHITRQFFIKARSHLEVSIERMAELAEVTPEQIQSFEKNNESELLKKIYLGVCDVQSEYNYFERRIDEFKNPKIRAEKQKAARSLYKQFGLLLPGADGLRVDGLLAPVVALRVRLSNDEVESQALS